jgi:hypothetical protein
LLTDRLAGALVALALLNGLHRPGTLSVYRSHMTDEADVTYLSGLTLLADVTLHGADAVPILHTLDQPS